MQVSASDTAGRGRRRRRRALIAVVAALSALASSLVALTTAPPAAAVPSTVPDETWVTNGRVLSVLPVGDRIYLGGTFTQIGPNTGFGVTVDPTSGARQAASTHVDGPVFAAVPDGAGGWYLGGSFSSVNGQKRGNGARILADGRLGSWDPKTNGAIRALAVTPAGVFVGGDFTTVRFVARQRLALTDASFGGLVGSFRADADAAVHSLAASPDGFRLFVGGAFLRIGGVLRSRVAAVAVSNGAVDLAFSPNPNGEVRALEASPDGLRLYVGGTFTVLGGGLRANLGAVNASTGIVDGAWTATTNAPVHTLALTGDGGRLFVGGAFTKIAGKGRNYAASLTWAGALETWNPFPSSVVRSIVLTADERVAYLGGSFLSLRSARAEHGGKVDAVTGVPHAGFDIRANHPVRAIVPTASRVFLGGEFTSVGAVRQPNLARLHASSGVLDTSYTPSVDGTVKDLELSRDGSTIYAVGGFTRVNGLERGRGAALSSGTGALLAWDPGANDTINTVAPVASFVYLGGRFTQLRGTFLTRLARVHLTTGAADAAWAPLPDNEVYLVVPHGGTVYVGGRFSLIGGTARRSLAEVTGLGVATAWNPNPPHPPLSGVMSPDGRTFYAGLGGGGDGGNSVNAYDTETSAQRWVVQGDGDVQALALSADATTLYAGGHFHLVLPVQPLTVRNGLMALNPPDGALLPWAPGLAMTEEGAWDLDVVAGALLVGGGFNRVDQRVAEGFARFAGTP